MPPIRTPTNEQNSAGPTPSRGSNPQLKWNHKNLRIELGLDEETMKKILDTMRQQMHILFDTNTLLSAQHEELRQLDLVLLKTYPSIFTDENDPKLKRLRIYAHKRHGQARHAQRRRENCVKTEDCEQTIPPRAPSQASSPAGTADPNPIDLTEDDIYVEEMLSPTVADPDANPSTSSSPPPSCSVLASLPASPINATTMNFEPPSPAPSLTSTILHSTPRSSQSLVSFGTTLPTTVSPSSASLLPSRPKATAGAASLVEYYSGSNIREVEGLRYFLCKFCDPPMASFLDRFLKYGCHSLAWLRPVRSWPEEVIDSFLRNLPKTNGREMTPMEVLVLRMCILRFPFDNQDSPQTSSAQIESC